MGTHAPGYLRVLTLWQAWDLQSVIVKSNDDLRQEAFAMQVGRYSRVLPGYHVRRYSCVLTRTVACGP